MWKAVAQKGFTKEEIQYLQTPRFKGATAAFTFIRLQYFNNNLLELNNTSILYSNGKVMRATYTGIRDNGEEASIIITKE